jgi:hypothetical protein
MIMLSSSRQTQFSNLATLVVLNSYSLLNSYCLLNCHTSIINYGQNGEGTFDFCNMVWRSFFSPYYDSFQCYWRPHLKQTQLKRLMTRYIRALRNLSFLTFDPFALFFDLHQEQFRCIIEEQNGWYLPMNVPYPPRR